MGLYRKLLLPAIIIAIVGFAEPAASARTSARKEDNSICEPDKEFVSQSAASIAAAISNSFPVSVVHSDEVSLNKIAGAESPWAGYHRCFSF